MDAASSLPFTIDITTGLLAGVRQVLSPHRDARPAGVPLELIVLHGISLPPGQFGGRWIDRLFCGDLPPDAHPYFATLTGSRVSAHLLVCRDGTVTQYVPFEARAWHAGVSSYRGRAACNDFSIGIELEGTDEVAYTDAQYRTSARAACRAMCPLPHAQPRAHRRPQRYRARAKDRSWTGVRLASSAGRAGEAPDVADHTL